MNYEDLYREELHILTKHMENMVRYHDIIGNSSELIGLYIYMTKNYLDRVANEFMIDMYDYDCLKKYDSIKGPIGVLQSSMSDLEIYSDSNNAHLRIAHQAALNEYEYLLDKFTLIKFNRDVKNRSTRKNHIL